MQIRSVWGSIGLVSCVCLLSACTLGKHYSEIDREGAKEDVRQHNGYYALKEISPGTSKLVFRSEGVGYVVRYDTSTEATACQGFENLGRVADAARGIIYPWIASLSMGMARTRSFLELELEAPSSIQVQGYGSSTHRTPLGTTQVNHCGPHTIRLSPKADRAYLVRFLLEGGQCRMDVSDSTDPDAPLPVSFERVADCPKP